MDLDVAWNRLSARFVKRDIHQTIGRFYSVRKTYSLLQKSRQAFNSHFYEKQLHLREKSLFLGVSPEISAREIRRRGVSFGLQLPSNLVRQIYDYASQNLLYEPGFEDEFYVNSIQNGTLPNGRSVLRGLVKPPFKCQAIEDLTHDPVLLKIARNYLQYWPTQVTQHLTWTFVSNLPVHQQKEQFLPLSYHYDVAGYNFMTAYFYITDMDAQSGAHVMIERSHNKKPLHTLFAPWSGRQPDEAILDYYGKDSEIVIEGKAGLGFVQDPSCFHKLLSPLKHRRLIFQIRYA